VFHRDTTFEIDDGPFFSLDNIVEACATVLQCSKSKIPHLIQNGLELASDLYDQMLCFLPGSGDVLFPVGITYAFHRSLFYQISILR
jgi:hypothetical protein